MFSYFTNKKRFEQAKNCLFDKLNSAARSPEFFGAEKVEDSPDGRFELVSLFCTSIFCAMANRGSEYRNLSQGLFDKVFKTFDQALRELGVGDMSVAKRIRKLSESFYGRQKSYMDLVYREDVDELSKKIGLNIFDRIDDTRIIDITLAKTAIELYSQLKNLTIDEIISLKNLS